MIKASFGWKENEGITKRECLLFHHLVWIGQSGILSKNTKFGKRKDTKKSNRSDIYLSPQSLKIRTWRFSKKSSNCQINGKEEINQNIFLKNLAFLYPLIIYFPPSIKPNEAWAYISETEKEKRESKTKEWADATHQRII